MYITDLKTKQQVVSYIRHKYGANIVTNRIYVFRYDYHWHPSTPNEYTVQAYKGYECSPFPERIPVVEVEKWGIILSRKDKIEKIRKNGNR
jgi:hypothetical protein